MRLLLLFLALEVPEIPIEKKLVYFQEAKKLSDINAAFEASLTPQQKDLIQKLRAQNQKITEISKDLCPKDFIIDAAKQNQDILVCKAIDEKTKTK